jgi:hypothetical protein
MKSSFKASHERMLHWWLNNIKMGLKGILTSWKNCLTKDCFMTFCVNNTERSFYPVPEHCKFIVQKIFIDQGIPLEDLPFSGTG